jgi:hypothetical protein
MNRLPSLPLFADEIGRVRASPRAAVAVETGSERLRRRARDLLVMSVVGPLSGVLAIAALHEVDVLRPGVFSPLPAPRAVMARSNIPPMAVPTVPDIGTLPPAPLPPPPPTAADFGPVQPTPDARHMADWVVSRDDNGRMPFFVIDKRDARLYVFRADGQLVGTAPVLLGAAKGDDSFPGIGNVPIPQVRPWQRTTPAGRFVTQPGLDDQHHDVVWIDYDAAVAMHRVINKVRAERRPERLATPSPRDNRISFGCINVPIDFFDETISPAFGHQRGVAYIIPEVRSFHEVFEEQAGTPALAAGTAVAKPMAPTAVR